MADECRTGKCPTCSRKPRQRRGKRIPGLTVVYRWKPGKGRELYRAQCPRCGTDLEQTTFNNLKRPHVAKGDPIFRTMPWEMDEAVSA